MNSRLALITDIHGNLSGLNSVLKDIENQNCDSIICLGDLVDGGPHSIEVVQKIQKLNIPCVRGNHDENHDHASTPEINNWLKELPDQIVKDDILFTHISPRKKQLSINTIYEAWNVFEETVYKRIFIGHLHYPIIFGEKSDRSCEPKEHEVVYNHRINLVPDDRYIIGVGPIGYTRDTINLLRYAIYDTSIDQLEMRKIEGAILDIKDPSSKHIQNPFGPWSPYELE